MVCPSKACGDRHRRSPSEGACALVLSGRDAGIEAAAAAAADDLASSAPSPRRLPIAASRMAVAGLLRLSG